MSTVRDLDLRTVSLCRLCLELMKSPAWYCRLATDPDSMPTYYRFATTSIMYRISQDCCQSDGRISTGSEEHHHDLTRLDEYFSAPNHISWTKHPTELPTYRNRPNPHYQTPTLHLLISHSLDIRSDITRTGTSGFANNVTSIMAETCADRCHFRYWNCYPAFN